MEDKLLKLEDKVNFLHSLIFRLARWTKFQDDVAGIYWKNEEVQNSKEEFVVENEELPEDRRVEGDIPSISSKISRNQVAKKSTSGVRHGVRRSRSKIGQLPLPAKKQTCENDEELSNFLLENVNLLEKMPTDEEAIIIKEEPAFGDGENNEEMPDENQHPDFSGPASTTEALEFSYATTNDLYNENEVENDEDFVGASFSESEYEPSSDEKYSRNSRKSPKKKVKTRKEPSSSNGKRSYKQRAKKVIVPEPLPKDIKPPYVSLNRIDAVTLKEKYKLTEPLPKESKKTYDCPKCEATFPLRRMKDAHTKVAHPKIRKMFKCSFCEKKFKVKNHCNEHELRHTGEKPHLCEHCGFSTGTRTSLLSHMECKHGLNKNRICNICQQKFRTRSQLRWHQMKTHRENKPDFPCEYCGAVFIRSSALRQHIAGVHIGIRNFQCDKCDKRFKDAGTLRDHLEKHEVGFKRNRGLQPIKIPAIKPTNLIQTKLDEQQDSKADTESYSMSPIEPSMASVKTQDDSLFPKQSQETNTIVTQDILQEELLGIEYLKHSC